MGIFSFLSSRGSFDQKFLDFLHSRGISEDVFKNFLGRFHIDNPYQIVGIDRDAFTFVPEGTAQDYFEYLAGRFELIQKYETISIEDMLRKKDTIFNPTIGGKKRIESVCEFLIAEGIRNPLSYIADGHYLYYFFDTSKALDRVKEKYYFLRDCSLFKGKISDMMSFVLSATYVTSLKHIREEINILEECHLSEYFLQNVNRFGCIDKGNEKLELFEKYAISEDGRNIFLQENFLEFFSHKSTLAQCEKRIKEFS